MEDQRFSFTVLKGEIFLGWYVCKLWNPDRDCQSYDTGNCHLPSSRAIVEKACLGKKKCSIQVLDQRFGDDPCPGIPRTLLTDAQCT
ncbi:hypothetical protein PTKIN_Ptkin01aG0022900 [Pterospermum kingtungense]